MSDLTARWLPTWARRLGATSIADITIHDDAATYAENARWWRDELDSGRLVLDRTAFDYLLRDYESAVGMRRERRQPAHNWSA